VLDVGGVELSGVADRIEIAGGEALILDFKTGKPPTLNEVKAGFSPQLPLEAAMLKRGAFKQRAGEVETPIPAAVATELIYWWFGGATPAPQPLGLDAMEQGESAFAAARGLLARYADQKQPFLSKPRVLKVRVFDDFDQLARRKEWADEKTDEQ